jgi:hypothetical protein
VAPEREKQALVGADDEAHAGGQQARGHGDEDQEPQRMAQAKGVEAGKHGPVSREFTTTQPAERDSRRALRGASDSFGQNRAWGKAPRFVRVGGRMAAGLQARI